MPDVPIARSYGDLPRGYKIGNAISGIGSGLAGLAQVLQQYQEDKKKKQFENALADMYKKDMDQQGQGAQTKEDIGKISEATGVSPLAVGSKMLASKQTPDLSALSGLSSPDMGLPNQSPDILSDMPSSPLAGMEEPQMAGLMGPQGAAPGMPGMGDMGAMGGGSPMGGESAMAEQMIPAGLQQLLQTGVPPDELQKSLQQMQEVSRLAAEAGRTDIALQMMMKRTEQLEKLHGANGDILKTYIAQQAQNARQKEQQTFQGGQLDKRIAADKAIAATKATQKANEPPKDDDYTKTKNRKEAEDFVKSANAIPQVEQSINNIDKALGIMDRVATGPIAGKNYAYMLQKIAKDDAQELEYYLSEENVRRVMSFAKDAGVRAIDTEQEQQRLLKSIANKEQSPAVLRKALQRMKDIQAEALRVARAKVAWDEEHHNMKGFWTQYKSEFGKGPVDGGKGGSNIVEMNGKKYEVDHATKKVIREVQ